MMRFSTQTEDALRHAGWYPGREVPALVDSWKSTLMASDGWEMFPSAERALLEFGGLKFNERGAGETCSREPFTIDPTDALYESDRFSDFLAIVNTRLYPLGEALGGLCFIAIGENNHVYLVEDEIKLLGKNIDEGLESLVRGLLPEEVIQSRF